MKVVRRKMSELHKTDINIRRHSEKQIREYVRSLTMFGQIRPLVITEDGEILIGNGMYEALQSMGAEECDVYVAEGLNKAQKKKLMLADNKVYELGFTDVDVLDDIIRELDGDFDVPGYDADLLDMLAKNPVEAGDEITGYGTTTPVVSSENVQQVVQRNDDAGQEQQYGVPVRSEDGGFVQPEKKEERQYITCPKCGEKIWL